MLRRDIAKHLGVSEVNLKRSCRDVRFHGQNGKYKLNPSLVKQVLDYYFEHGKLETQKAFPKISVKSIVDRPEFYNVSRQYRQIRWTDEQHLEAVKMAGLISYQDQARFFNRPRANAGSIKSFWVKRVRTSDGYLHGMAEWNAKWIVTDRCPRLTLSFSQQRMGSKHTNKTKKLILWVDAEKHLRPEVPESIKIGVQAMADFTRRIFKSKNPKRQITKMIQERSA